MTWCVVAQVPVQKGVTMLAIMSQNTMKLRRILGQHIVLIFLNLRAAFYPDWSRAHEFGTNPCSDMIIETEIPPSTAS